MIRVAILGKIGSGKTFVANNFGYPVFNADLEVGKIYKNDKDVYKKLKKKLPEYFSSFPINKKEVLFAILDSKTNLKKIVEIVHLKVRKKLIFFLKKNKNKKIVILDIPLFLENKLNKKRDILIFLQSRDKDIQKRLTKRKNYNKKLIDKFKEIQLSSNYKKSRSRYIIKNNFNKNFVKKKIKIILKDILK